MFRTPLLHPRNPRLAAACACAAIIVAAAGCTQTDDSVAGVAPPKNQASGIDLWPQPQWPFAEDPALEKRVADLLAQMSVEEKVGQIVQGDIASITPDDERKYRLGSILAGGNSDPGGKYNAAPAAWLGLADAFYDASMDTSHGGHAIPVIFGIDAVHGQSNIVGATLFPHNIGLGAMRDPDLIRRIGEVTAIETRTTGMEWTFAPTVAVPQDDRWGRTYEGYSESPDVVASYAGRMVEGLQGKVGSKEFLDGAHVAATIKHFLGDGGTANGKDQGDAHISEAELVRVHNAGYPPAIAAGAQSVMASFSSWNGNKMTGNKYLLTDVLKQRMHFGGFVVSDWNAHGQLPGCSNDSCPAAINAGLDMFMAPDSWKAVYASTLAAVKAGVIPMARLDDAVARILRVKFRLGLFNAGKPSQRPYGGKFELLGSPPHRAVARQAVRESLVLLKNSHHLLPLQAGQHILVAGDHADDMSRQTGGWTLTWQGTGTHREDFPHATTIYEGIAAQVKAAGGATELAVDGNYTRKPDVAIVVFGENPYAEFQGDLADLRYKPGDDTDLDLIKQLKADGIPVVAVFLSGRPLWVNREINAADAFVAAWLPGSEGEGIADVLLRKPDGSVQYDFRGKLSYSWPRTAVQFADNVGQKDYHPQFPFGYGLTYEDNGDLAPLPEVSGVSGAHGVAGVYFAHGKPAAGFSLWMDGDKADAPQRIDAVPASTADGSLRVTAIDHDAQEDARRFVWSGAAGIALAADAPLDLTRESNGDIGLVLTLRTEQVPVGAITLEAGCGDGCRAQVPIHDALAGLPAHRWTTLGVPLKCFAAAGADVARLQRFGLHAASSTALSLARVALGAQNEAEHEVACTAR
jgi:beta-glucosidase